MSSRWDSLKCEREPETGRRNNNNNNHGGSRRNRSLRNGGGGNSGGKGNGNRWAVPVPSRSDAHPHNEHQKHHPESNRTLMHPQQQQQQQPQQASLVEERDALVDSLRSQIVRYRSSEGDRTRQHHERSILIERLATLFPDPTTRTTTSQNKRSNNESVAAVAVAVATTRTQYSPRPTDPDLFAELLAMLEIDSDNEGEEPNHGGAVEEKNSSPLRLRLEVARSIESFVRHSANDSENGNENENENTNRQESLFTGWTKSKIQHAITTLSFQCSQTMTAVAAAAAATKTTTTTNIDATTPLLHLQHSHQSPSLATIHSTVLVSLAVMVRSCADRLAPEWTARNVVGTAFIPYLSSSSSSSSWSSNKSSSESATKKTSVCVSVCEALIALLGRPGHASAMLAPLVENVSVLHSYSPGGCYTEEQTANPLRKKLLGVLMDRLESPSSPLHSGAAVHESPRIHAMRRSKDEEQEQVVVCRTLSASIDAIRKLRKGNDTHHASQNKADAEIVVRPLEKILSKVVAEYSNNHNHNHNHNDNNKTRQSGPTAMKAKALMIASLHLLRALIACYPSEITGLGWKLVIEGASQNQNLASSRAMNRFVTFSPAASSYLPSIVVLHNSIAMQRPYVDTTHVALAMECVADFISVLPWNKWLKQSAFGKSPKTNTSGLYKTVANALCALLGIAKHAFERCDDKTPINGLGRLVKALFAEIPYYDDKVVHAGVDLWESVSRTIRCRFLQVVDAAANKEKQILALQILIASSGGTVTPEGNLRGMSVPLRTWFLTEDPCVEAFVAGLIESFRSLDRRSDWAAKILSCVLRTLPDVALQRWNTFGRAFRELNTSSTSKMDQMRLEVLESFVIGRKDFEVSTDLQLVNDSIILDVDGLLLQSWGRNGLRQRLRIYSAFRSQDWIQLDRIDGRVLGHFDQILDQCNDSGAKIRETAAKALGEFCSRYILPSPSPDGIQMKMQLYSVIADRVRLAMIELCNDQNAAARSMAIFCLGNLVSALNESNCREIFDSVELQEISKAILASLDDGNDKVVKNAIRSIGHTGNSLAYSLRCKEQADNVSLTRELLVEVMESLTLKLSKTLHVACNEDQKATMTWKERSAAKKHGWGACHSLGLVFEGLSVEIVKECNALESASSKAVRCLVRCVCKHAALNEKVVLASMAAFRQVQSQLLARIDSNLSDALATSLWLLEGSRTNHGDGSSSSNSGVTRDLSKPVAHSSRVVAENKDFLCHVLGSASLADANLALLAEQETETDPVVTPRTLCVLYAWMVEAPQLEKLPARAFEVFAVALQRQRREPWSSTVGLEQQFTSRAIQKRKLEQRRAPAAARSDSNFNSNSNANAISALIPGAWVTEGGAVLPTQQGVEDEDEEADEL
eukprot:jgi/Psemu1/2597/gm1.2597_g